MSKYLYGAAVQGIQGYIFQTNELQDIIGASAGTVNIGSSKAYKVIAGSHGIGSGYCFGTR